MTETIPATITKGNAIDRSMNGHWLLSIPSRTFSPVGDWQSGQAHAVATFVTVAPATNGIIERVDFISRA